jgi:D-3-phosphoglycerate dehydrogenase
MKKQVLIIDEVHESLISGLENQGFLVNYLPKIAKSEVSSELKNVSGLILRSKLFLDAISLASAENLEFIGRAGAGLDLIDLEYVASKNIHVFSANEGNKDAVAEHVIGQLLSIAHKLHHSDREVRAGLWQREENRGWELQGKTLGIIGYGNMGQALAEKIQGFGINILAYDKYHPTKKYGASLEEIFEKADILSLHVPLTSETKNMVSEEFLSKFQKSIVLINSSRGQITPLAPLLWGLENQKIKGLALDVLPNEKISSWTAEEKQLFQSIEKFPNTLFSPHVAGWTTESYWKINEVLLQKIKSFYHP